MTAQVGAGRMPVAALLFALMACVALAGHWVQPEKMQVRSGPSAFSLDKEIPTRFGMWSLVPAATGIVANPETQEVLDKLYSQILTRVYVDASGYQIMLSLAYGEDQRGGLQPHRPEVCYPAQGFEVRSNEPARITTGLGVIEGRRLVTQLSNRSEPLTYWLAVGGRPVDGPWMRRVEEIRLLFTGQVPDGLIFRVSSIDKDTERAFLAQERFVADLMSALPQAARRKLSGM